MSIPLVMTVIGADRPGLVETLARLVAEHGGNWLDSRMCRLGGQFAGILRVRVPADREVPLRQALSALAKQGLIVVVHADPETPDMSAQRLVGLEIIGQDRPGIVRQIASALAAQGINVEEFTSECRSAPMTGETLFAAKARLRLPEACNEADLRRGLEQIAGDLMVDLHLQSLPNPATASSLQAG
jgi:glycine cleavage system regulatory protein